MKKITSIILAIIMLFSTVVIANINVTAANYTTKYWNYTEPTMHTGTAKKWSNTKTHGQPILSGCRLH